jgi:hypothetical protein
MWYTLGAATAGEAVSVCREAFMKDNWAPPSGGGLPTTVGELMARYIHEYGDVHLYFDGTQPLTKELAEGTLINDIRNMYYQGIDVGGPTLFEFNASEAVSSLILDMRNSALTFNLPLSAFLGSFIYQVKTLDNDRIGFRIDNDTTIESGTHIGGRYPYQGFRQSVEALIEQRPDLANTPLYEIINNPVEYKVVSILKSRSREQTKGSFGGGNMYQTFTWTEKRDECLANHLPWEVHAFMLDIRPWTDYQIHTEPIFPPYDYYIPFAGR